MFSRRGLIASFLASFFMPKELRFETPAPRKFVLRTKLPAANWRHLTPEDTHFLEGISQQVSSTFHYVDPDALPHRFTDFRTVRLGDRTEPLREGA